MPLIHQWKFNGSLQDSVGDLDLVDIGNKAAYTNGIVEKCLDYPDGPSIGQGLGTGENPLPSTPNHSWSICFWIRNVEEDVFFTLIDGLTPRLYFSRSTEKNVFKISFNDGTNSGEALLKLGTNSLKNQFTHFAFIYRASNLIPKLYINGVEQVGQDIDFIQSFTTNLISKQNNTFIISNTDYGYQLEDLRIYDEAITEAEVLKIYDYICAEINEEKSLYIKVQPTGQYQNVRFTQAEIEIRDINNQLVDYSDIEIYAEVYSGGGTLLGTLVEKAYNGIAVFNDLRINQSGTFKIKFYALCSTVTYAISNNIVLIPFLGTLTLDEPDLTLFIKSDENDHIDLYTVAHARIPNLLLMFLKCIPIKGMTLYTQSAYFKNGDIDLYLNGRLNGVVSLYVEGMPKRPNSLDLYIEAQFTQNIPLFIVSRFEEIITLYTQSSFDQGLNLFLLNRPEGVMPFFLKSSPIPTQNQFLNLMLTGYDPNTSQLYYSANIINLFINNYLNDSMPFYMEVENIAYKNNYMPLFTNNFIRTLNSIKNLNMYIQNNNLGKDNSINLFVGGDGSSFGFKPFNGSMPLFMERDFEYFARHLNLTIRGQADITNNKTLIITGANLFNSNLNMVMPIISNVFSDGVDLYTHGFNEG